MIPKEFELVTCIDPENAWPPPQKSKTYAVLARFVRAGLDHVAIDEASGAFSPIYLASRFRPISDHQRETVWAVMNSALKHEDCQK